MTLLVEHSVEGHGRQQNHLLLDASLGAPVDLAQLCAQDQQREANSKQQLQNNEADRQLATNRAVTETGHPYPFLPERGSHRVYLTGPEQRTEAKML